MLMTCRKVRFQVIGISEILVGTTLQEELEIKGRVDHVLQWDLFKLSKQE